MAAPSLPDLLTYIEEVERLNKTPAFQVPEDVFSLAEADLVGFPGVARDLEQDGAAWLVVPRVHEQAVPPLPEGLKPFVTLSASPDTAPVLTVPAAGGVPCEAAQELALRAAFERYLSAVWQPWASLEGPRRQTIGLYRRLFALQQKLSGPEDAALELVWGVGLAAWSHPAGKVVRHPLLTQGCFVELDKDTFTLTVRPRDVEPHLELDCYVELDVAGVRDLESFWLQRRTLAAPVNPFQPESFIDVLRTAVSALDSAGSLVTGMPVPGSNLAVSASWVLYARKRSADVFVEDVRRFLAAVEAGVAVPDVVQAFVSEAPDRVRELPHIEFRGLSNSSSAPEAQELYFPLPYNEEQVDIVRKLEGSDGVVVQGPPGTGKTHTIANIVSHYLAQGKRVLVTSKGDTALSVLRDKLPAGVRDLSVALLANERAGMRQFEHAIQQIAVKVAGIRPAALEANIAHLAQSLVHAHAKVADLDAQLAEYAKRNVSPIELDGATYRADELAQMVVQRVDVSTWLQDPVDPATELPWTDTQLQVVRSARRALGSDLHHIAAELPAPELLVTWQVLRGQRANLIREKTLRARIAAGKVLLLVDPQTDRAQLESAVQVVEAALAQMGSLPASLLMRAPAYALSSPLAVQIQAMAKQVLALELTRQELVAHAVVIPEGVDAQAGLTDALDRLVEGKSAFSFGAGLFGGKKEVQHQLGRCIVMGAAAHTAENWRHVQSALAWRSLVRALIHRWNAMCFEFGMLAAPTALDEGFRHVSEQLPKVAAALALVHETLPGLRLRFEALFGPEAAARASSHEGLASVSGGLGVHLELGRLAAQNQAVDQLLAALGRGQGELNAALLSFLQARLPSEGEQESELADAWGQMCSQVARVHDWAPAFEQVREAAGRLERLGLTQWAGLLRAVPCPATGEDPVLPTAWRDAWQCRVAESILAGIDGHNELRGLHAQRHELTLQLATAYRELVAERAWLGVYRNSTDKTKQALQSFLTSIQAMGAGTGLRAVRHRRAAREAMEKAYLSVPCWILPQWRISETLPAEMGLFDLVVIDEASQSDVSSLPAILRGRKLLVVGDHKQVSPAAVGVSETKIASVYDRLLKHQPHGAHMTADKSIYDLARVVFAGQSVMLKEHFRCVPAIIEYSNREFYNGEIRALRVPRESERMDPPLVDVYVRGGCRSGDKNIPEATAIVDEIVAILADPAAAGKTIGVVTLVGHEQARLITEMVSARVAPEDIVTRDIVVGQPPAFQGRERDIILVSMVQAPDDRSFSSALAQQQRLNVALSRARDRMYLFRSVPDGHFSADSMSGRLMAHFKQPFHTSAVRAANLRELCESAFEREVFDELVLRGYRVQPQVRAGGYRIDLVVEGSEGRRLAVECDGDRYHGPDKWTEDMARQRVLERAGWTFWRCFASSFTRRRQDVVLDLLATLNSLGIEPLGDAEPVQDLVEQRTADPMRVAA